MSEDPAPYAVQPRPIPLRAILAVCADPEERVASPWQGAVLWWPEGSALGRLAAAPRWAFVSKS